MHLLLELVDLVNLRTKNKHVVNTHLLGDFNVGTVHGSDDETTIHNEFHIAGAAGFSTGC